jgi:outer membrane biosynthesis protein TonB
MNHANIMNARSKSRPLTTPAARNNEMSAFAIFALALTFSVLTFSVAGCQRNIVKASPPSVSTPPPPEATPSPAPPSEPQTTTAPPSASEPAPPPTPAPQATPTKPKPSTPTATEPEKPAETPRPEAPVISPQLTPQAQAAAEQRTNADIKRAEQNLQIAESKQLDEAQHDLVEKVRDFLAQAHEAIHGEDWVRASNLAEKARVLSDELVKSL